MSNLSCGTHVAEPSANKDCRKLLNQFCRFLPKLKLPISADAKLPLTPLHLEEFHLGIFSDAGEQLAATLGWYIPSVRMSVQRRPFSKAE